MTRPSYCSLFALLAPTLGLLCACSGTETDNPVVGSAGPVINGPSNEMVEQSPPGCTPGVAGTFANVPTGLSRSLRLPAPNQNVLATGRDSGLDFLDVSDPAHPVTLSSDVVRGTIHQLLPSSSGKLWVAATEPPSMPDSGLPDQPVLDSKLHIVELDVSDPREPLRVAEAELDEKFWQMQERGDSLWVLSPRLIAEQRSCSYVIGLCGGADSFEAMVLRGFSVNASELTANVEAELPFDTRAFWRPDGVVTSLADGSLHVLAWDAQGNLRAPLTLTSETPVQPTALGFPAPHVLGPVDVVGNQLSVVDTSSGHTLLNVYDLDGDLSAPRSSADLGPTTGPWGEFSLLDSGRLWLSNDDLRATAQLWDVSRDTPQRIELPQDFMQILPISGATLDADPTALLAVGWGVDNSNFAADLLSFAGGQVKVLGPLSATFATPQAGQSTAAPSGVSNSGSHATGEIVVRGAGLPLGVDASPPPFTGYPWAFVGVPLSHASASSAEAQIAQAALLDDNDGSVSLQITSGSTSTNFDAPPGATKLIALPDAVIVVADEPVTQCEQSGADCDGYEPGIVVYDLSGPARLAGNLAFPALPVGSSSADSSLDVAWQFLGALGDTRNGTPIGTSQLTLVANVELSCTTESDCAALGITPLPLAQAGVATGAQASCSSGAPGDPTGGGPCPPAPPPPTVYGESQRAYFYALVLDSELQPSWQALGVSAGESSSARPEIESRFASPIAAGGVAAATRLEHTSASGDALARGQVRIMFDRFELGSDGSGRAYPPVNVIGYPVARFADSGTAQRWLSVDPAAASTSDPAATSTLHLLSIDTQGAHDAQSLPLPGIVAGVVTLQEEDGTAVPVALTVPKDSCGSSQLTAFSLDANGTLQSLSTLALPADRWSFVAADGARVALNRDQVYALVELDGDALSVHSLRSTDAYANEVQLLGTTLRGAGIKLEPIDF